MVKPVKLKKTLEKEKEIAESLWQEAKDTSSMNFHKIYSAMSRLNDTDRRLIEMGRYDLLG